MALTLLLALGMMEKIEKCLVWLLDLWPDQIGSTNPITHEEGATNTRQAERGFALKYPGGGCLDGGQSFPLLALWQAECRYASVLDPSGQDPEEYFAAAAAGTESAGWAILGAFGAFMNVAINVIADGTDFNSNFNEDIAFNIQNKPGFAEGYRFGSHMIEGLALSLSAKQVIDLATIPPPQTLTPALQVAGGGTRAGVAVGSGGMSVASAVDLPPKNQPN